MTTHGPIVRAFRQGDREKLADLVDVGDMVLAVDPGAAGLAALFPPVETWPWLASRPPVPPKPLDVYPFRSFDGLHRLRDVLHSVSDGPIEMRLTVVMEESFGGGRLNVATDIKLARYAGAVIGALSAMSPPADKVSMFDVALVMPSTWRGSITHRTGGRTKRKEHKITARSFAETHLGVEYVAECAKTAPHREAFCDAFGIATWWGAFASKVMTRRRRDGTR